MSAFFITRWTLRRVVGGNSVVFSSYHILDASVPQTKMTEPRIQIRSLEDALASTAPECRMHVDGLDPQAGFVLPSIAVARKEAGQIQQTLSDPVRTVLFDSKRNVLFNSLCEPLGWNLRLPNLFKFSFFVHAADMPEDLLKPCIWALKTFKRVMEEASDEELHSVNHLLPHQEGEDAKKARKLFLINIRMKLATYHLMPSINQPGESVKFFEEVISALLEEPHDPSEGPWIHNPVVHEQLGEALFWAGGRTKYEKAKIVLKQALSSPKIDVVTIVGARTYLSRVLRALGDDAEAETEEAWVIKWYRKNPRLMEEKAMRKMLLNADGTSTSILDALGGLDWLESRRHTQKTEERKTRMCRQCLKREPAVKLSRCGRCQYIWYCSKACQKANWSAHKIQCIDMVEERRKIEALSLIDSIGSQRAADWAEWRGAPHDGNSYALIHALGVHRDRSRGRTHIVFKELAWNPKSKTLRNKFVVKSCGVFKVSEVLLEIEGAMGLNSGEGKEYVESVLVEFEGKMQTYVPIMDLSFGEGIQTWLGSTGIGESSLRNLEYNPNWREIMNPKGDPPAKLRLKRTTVKDAEHVF